MRGDASRVFGPGPRLVLAMALHQSGQAREARKTLAAAVLAFDWRANHVKFQNDWIFHVLRREAEHMILPGLPAFLAGTYQPHDNDERVALIGICQFTNRTHALARLFADDNTSEPQTPSDLAASYRYTAARAAALAGCGRGDDAVNLDLEERSRLRKQARLWLELDLAALEKMFDNDNAGEVERREVRRELSAWRAEPDLAGLREPGARTVACPGRRSVAPLWKKVDAFINQTSGDLTKLLK